MKRRTKRVASLIRGELSRLLVESVSDPALKDVVVTDVELTDDLKSARVYFGNFQETKDLSGMQKGWHRASPFLRHKLGDNLKLRTVPELKFVSDEHNQTVYRVMSLLDEVRKEGEGVSQ